MYNKKIRNHAGIKTLYIIFTFLITCTAAFAKPENMTKNDSADPNIQKTFTVRHIDPNKAAKVVEQIIKLKIFQLSKDTLLVPNPEKKLLTVRTENPGQMNLIEKLIKNIDFQIKNEGIINKTYIQVKNRIFDEIYRIISPILSEKGSTSYNITAHTLVVTEIVENQNHIENLVKIIDSNDFDDPNSIFTGDLIYLVNPGDPNEEINKPNNVRNFQLKYMKPTETKQILEPLISEQGYINANDDEKTLFIADSTESLKRLEEIIKEFDIEHASFSQGGIFVKPSGDPREITNIINLILKGQSDPNSFRYANPTGRTRRNAKRNADANSTEIKAIETNDPMIDINLSNAGINQIIETLIRLTGKAVIPSNEALGLKITLSSPERVRQSEALKLLYDAIKEQGFIIENKNNIIYIKPAAQRSVFETNLSGFEKPKGITDENEIKDLDVSNINNINPMVPVNLLGLNIEQIKQTLLLWTGKKVEPSQEAMDIKVTLFSPEIMKRSEAIALLYTAIRQMGYIIEEAEDKIYIKTPPFKPDTAPLIEPNEPLENMPNKDLIVGKIFKLKYSSPSLIGQLIRPYLDSYGYYTTDDSTNTLLIIDTVKNLTRIEQMVEIFDADPNSLPKGGVIYPVNCDNPNNTSQRQEHDAVYVKFIDADTAAVKLKEILMEMGIDTKIRLIILPLATSKQILVFGNNKDDRELAESLIHDIDLQSFDNSYGFENISLEYFDPEIFTDLGTKVIEEDKNIRLSLYPNVPLKQILVFGQKEYRDVIGKFAKEIDISPSQENTKEPNLPNSSVNNNLQAPQPSRHSASESILGGFGAGKRAGKGSATGDNKKLILPLARNIVEGIKKFFRGKSDSNYDTISINYTNVNELAANITTIIKNSDKEFSRNISIQPLVQSKQVLVFGKKQYRDKVKKLIAVIDTQSFQNAQEHDIIPIKYVDFNELTDVVFSILKESDIDYKNKITIVPLTEFKTFIIYGDKDYCQKIKILITESSESPQLVRKAFKLKYLNAEKLKTKLDEVFGNKDTSDESKSKTLPEDTVITTIYPSLNELVVLASKENITKITSLIERLDQKQANHEDSTSPNVENIETDSGLSKP